MARTAIGSGMHSSPVYLAHSTDQSGTSTKPRSLGPTKQKVLFSKTGQPPKDPGQAAFNCLKRQAGQGGPHGRDAQFMMQLAETIAELPTRSFDINETIKTGQPAPMASGADPENKASQSTVDAAVRAYAKRTYWPHRANPFEAPSTDGQPVRDLLQYITGQQTDGLAEGGRSIKPLNQFGGRSFESRAQALHFLLHETPFLSEVPPGEANRFMKMHEELVSQGL